MFGILKGSRIQYTFISFNVTNFGLQLWTCACAAYFAVDFILFFGLVLAETLLRFLRFLTKGVKRGVRILFPSISVNDFRNCTKWFVANNFGRQPL